MKQQPITAYLFELVRWFGSEDNLIPIQMLPDGLNVNQLASKAHQIFPGLSSFNFAQQVLLRLVLLLESMHLQILQAVSINCAKWIYQP
jgi:hypothetical protein